MWQRNFTSFFPITWSLLETTKKYRFLQNQEIKSTLMQIWKSGNTFVFIWKYVENFTQKHLLLFETWAREMCEKFVYKHSETIEFVKE